jgi:trehalose 6-phosphate phosphatase
MIALFTEAGRAALSEFLTKPALCLFDFDGTLAPLASDPDRVSLPRPIQQRLQALQPRTPVGIITGRSLADMQKRLTFEPDYVIGNHGLEGLPGWQRCAPAYYATCRGWKLALSALRKNIDDKLWIEDKAYSLTVHYRHAADPSSVEHALLAQFSQLLPPPRIIAGKFNFSLLPPNAGDKGQAVQQLLKLSPGSRALYVGDDQTDEDVFALHHPEIFSIRVGHETRTAASYGIADHTSIVTLLDWLMVLLPAEVPEKPLVFGTHRS